MTYTLLKTLHILSMVLLFGTGLGSAFYKWMADRSGNVAHIAVTNRHVVLADWIFTTPTVIFQPISGLWMVYLLDLPLSTPWIAASLALFVLAGVCWLPVVWRPAQPSGKSRCRRLTGGSPATGSGWAYLLSSPWYWSSP